MESGQPVELPDDYYLSNFHALAGFVYETYHDLLQISELDWYKAFKRCDESAQRLYVRLLTRKSSVFRVSRLRYPEIASLQSAASQLAIENLAVIVPPCSMQELMAAFTKPELLKLLDLNELRSNSRVDLVENIMKSDEVYLHQFRGILQSADQWISIRGHSYWNLYNLCFFGNLYQDSSEFVLRDLGAVTYESYQIAPNCRAFTSRVQIEAHMKYFECSILLDTISRASVEQHKNVLCELPSDIPGDSQLTRRLDRLRNRIGRQLERLGDTNAALMLFKQSQHPPARERRVRILLSEGALDQASSIINDMTTNPRGESELQVAGRLLKQWAKVSGCVLKAEKRFRPSTSTLILRQSALRVELETRTFYSKIGTCFYTENQLVNGVLGLFIWDIIFTPIAGVFHNPFQQAPSDFYDPEFRERRADMLDQRFTELDDTLRFCARIMENFEIHWGKTNPMVRWAGIPYELLSLALQRVPAAHWRVMFDRILKDPRENMAGFPDLILFRGDDSYYEFIEVKGPGDTIQQNQLRWMQCFSKNRIPCRVVNVRWAEVIPSIGSA
ncbi:MAG: hypothetical protein ACI9XK_000323 [Granulosicoccus sp.]|jgi:hypothetical protein